MKTFKDLKFKTHHYSGKQAELKFTNNFGVSVLLGDEYYSNGVDTYEVATLLNDHLVYIEGITDDDVAAYPTAEEVTELMEKVQQLPKIKQRL